MTSLTGEEPDLELGATGEWVVMLQVRLFYLGLYREVPDQTYNATTEQAVRELQNRLGHSATGVVTRETWEGLLYAETQAAIQYRWPSPYDALDQLVYDLQNGVRRDGSGNLIPPDQYEGQLSDDGEYRWDGYDWQSVGGDGGPVEDSYVGQLSDDGRYSWDGNQWQAVAEGDESDSYVGQLSDDGHYQWDGSDWQAVHGAEQGYVGQLSDDGLWRWDGYQWQAA